MSICKYPESPMIDEVAFRKTSSGALRAYLHLKDNADQGMLTGVVDTLRSRGWQAIPTSENDRPELEVRGFRNESQLITALQEKKCIAGTGTRIEEAGDKVTFGDKFGKQTLFLSSLSYLAGDLAFYLYGNKENCALKRSAGLAYFGGTFSNFLFGSNPLIGRPDRSDLDIHDMSQKMADYMNSQNIQMSPESSINSILDDHKKGLIKKGDDLCRHYPVEMMNSFYALAGVCIAAAAYKQLHVPVDPKGVEQYVAKRISAIKAAAPGAHIPPADIAKLHERGTTLLNKLHHTTSWLDVGLGGLTFGSAIFGNLVGEKKRDPDEPHRQGLEGIWDWIQERPLTMTGAGYMVATMCHAVSTGIDYSVGTVESKKALMFRGTFVATNLIAELLIAMSSKGHGHGVVADDSITHSMISIAADTIAKQPPNMQEDMIEHVARFLGQKDTLALKDEDVKRDLRHQVEIMRNNPWAHASAACLKEEAKTNPAPVAITTVAPAKAEKLPHWQAKLAAAAAVDKNALPQNAV